MFQVVKYQEYAWQIVLSLLDKALKVTALFDWLIQIEASIEQQKQAAACLYFQKRIQFVC